MRITVIVPPWLTQRGERAAMAQAAAGLGSDIEVLEFTGRAPVAAFAAQAARELQNADHQLVLLPAGPEGEEAASLIAAQRNGVSLGRCTHVEFDGHAVIARRAVFGGRAEVTLRSDAAVTCVTLRPDSSATPASSPSVRHIAIDEPLAFDSEPVADAATHPRLEGAGVVVSGGRGIGAPEGFDMLSGIARQLGAGLGGSLPAVDAGWVPVAHQVGQSGKFVSPKVYFAVAISGTPQHLAGVSGHARIVALNKDADAPIFQRCDVGVLGDWNEILPLLAKEIETLRG